MSENRLHHDFVLNFGEEVVRYFWVKDFLDCAGGAVEEAFVDYGEAALADLLAKFDIGFGDLADTRYGRETTSCN